MLRMMNVGKQSDRVDRPEKNDCAVDLQSISADWQNHPRYSSSYYSLQAESAKVSNSSGRKIDMKSATTNGIEVVLCEFKKNVDRNELDKQQGKRCRLKVSLLEDLNTINISDIIITTIWGDM
ncbi:hypothetical protein EDC96DRAFT_568658 [Choanephora cucurbitarum]|nr:hypothetical protein EDC96DRAFT_568658 [Choanephora cucurbitarum]